jgi:predicted small secreted protein
MRRTHMRTYLATGIALAAAATLLAGCGTVSSGSGTGPGAGGSGSGGPSGAKVTSLQVTVRDSAGAAPTVWTLTCDPPGGTHPQSSAACAQLSAAKSDPFAPTPKGMMCSMIYGGDQKATVTGTFEGRRVDTSFGRADGCAVARWSAVSALLVIKGGA